MSRSGWGTRFGVHGTALLYPSTCGQLNPELPIDGKIIDSAQSISDIGLPLMVRPSHAYRFGSGHPKLSSTVATEFPGFIRSGVSSYMHRGFLLSARHVPIISGSTIAKLSTPQADRYALHLRAARGWSKLTNPVHFFGVG